MKTAPGKQEIDYLILGHITRDLTVGGDRTGGTAAYGALTAHRLGARVGIVTSTAPDLNLSALREIPIANVQSNENTTFENLYTSQGRRQVVYGKARRLSFQHVPSRWRSAAIVHLAPVLDELDPKLGQLFPSADLGFSLQGWLRKELPSGKIAAAVSCFPDYTGRKAVAVLSLEDLDGKLARLDKLQPLFPRLILTRGKYGADLFYPDGSQRHLPTQPAAEIDPTGAGDIFAAAFFTIYFQSQNISEAGRLAAALAASSVSRPGLKGVPDRSEIQTLREVV